MAGPPRAEAATFRPVIAPGARRALRTATFTISAIPVVSQAAMNGVPLPVVVHLLGHSYMRMTMRYAHVGDREVEAAAERARPAVDTIMGQGGIHCSNGDGFANLPPRRLPIRPTPTAPLRGVCDPRAEGRPNRAS